VPACSLRGDSYTFNDSVRHIRARGILLVGDLRSCCGRDLLAHPGERTAIPDGDGDTAERGRGCEQKSSSPKASPLPVFLIRLKSLIPRGHPVMILLTRFSDSQTMCRALATCDQVLWMRDGFSSWRRNIFLEFASS
jgi:hypothetical protein